MIQLDEKKKFGLFVTDSSSLSAFLPTKIETVKRNDNCSMIKARRQTVTLLTCANTAGK